MNAGLRPCMPRASNAPALALAIAGLLLASTIASAATPAGTIIRNQASASWRDADGIVQGTTSNVVETTIRQVAGLALTIDRDVRAAPGTTVELHHTLINTGNGADTYALMLQQSGGDDFDLESLQLLLDADRDGVPDTATSVTSSPLLAPGKSIDLIIRGRLPAGALASEIANLSLISNSDFDATTAATNDDGITADAAATLAVRKRIDRAGGPSPSGPYRITIEFENRGNSALEDIVLIDALPAGMTYVPDSARWSASNTVPSDADPGDTHAGGSALLRFCAYQPSCTGLPESIIDANADSTDQVTARLDRLAAGDRGTLLFDVSIDAGLAAGTLINQAEHEYRSGAVDLPRELGNAVAFRVDTLAGVVANGSNSTPLQGMSEPVSVLAAPAGGTVRFDNLIWNTGNAADSFQMSVDPNATTFPVGTTWRLLQADGATLLQDSDGDGIVDTGPVEPGAAALVVLELGLPPGTTGSNGGAGYDLVKIARSGRDARVSDTVTDHLGAIVGASVDLTNQAPAGQSGALGEGAGPEAVAVSTRRIDAGGTASFELFVRHEGGSPASYRLDAFADASRTALPAGWRVKFVDAESGSPVAATRIIAAGDSTHLRALVTPPADAAPGITSLFFGATSTLSAAFDLKHDAIEIDGPGSASLQLEPSLEGQLTPGGSISYTHRLYNGGNSAIADIVLELDDSAASWSSALYLDTDGDGRQGASDNLVTGPLSLGADEAATLFIVVFAPADAASLATNRTSLVATSAAIGASVGIIDTSTVNGSPVTILKEQAPDLGCDGGPDAGSEFAADELAIPPGNNCVIYRLTAINRGVEAALAVAIHDHTPPWTRYRPVAACSSSPCSLSEPAAEGTGPVRAEVDTLAPGDRFELRFSVRIE